MKKLKMARGVSFTFSENGTELEIYLLDATHDLKLIQRSVFYGNKFTWEPKVANYDCYLIKLKRK